MLIWNTFTGIFCVQKGKLLTFTVLVWWKSSNFWDGLLMGKLFSIFFPQNVKINLHVTIQTPTKTTLAVSKKNPSSKHTQRPLKKLLRECFVAASFHIQIRANGYRYCLRFKMYLQQKSGAQHSKNYYLQDFQAKNFSFHFARPECKKHLYGIYEIDRKYKFIENYAFLLEREIICFR